VIQSVTQLFLLGRLQVLVGPLFASPRLASLLLFLIESIKSDTPSCLLQSTLVAFVVAAISVEGIPAVLIYQLVF
jgi:hypothetical protein